MVTHGALDWSLDLQLPHIGSGKGFGPRDDGESRGPGARAGQASEWGRQAPHAPSRL